MNNELKEKLENWLTENYSEEDIVSKIDETIPEYLDPDWEDDFGDIYEAYVETGRGEAESQVINEIIEEFGLSTENRSISDTDLYLEIYDYIKEKYDINV